MKINKQEVEEHQSGDFESIEAGIATENLGLALTMVSKNLYSNPIGSFIREITTNAYDANIDNDATEPVHINVFYEDGEPFITFTDKGEGMTPEVFRTIYMNWFSSDKRGTNEKHGGWGLGSKSPFSYQDDFEIITRVDGIEYHYILVNKDPKPEATLLNKEPYIGDTGTTIKIALKSEDIWTVNKEFSKQLCYFDNVYIKDELRYYDNNFKLYESEDFVLRNTKPPFDDMHLVLGQVPYPINWDVLGLQPIGIPVAIKFDIGDLDVTLSREAIDYAKEETINKIKEKALSVKNDLIERYKNQIVVDDLFEYIDIKNNREKVPLIIEDVKIQIKNNKYPITLNPYDDVSISTKAVTDFFYLYNVTKLKSGKHYRLYADSKHYYGHLYNHSNECYYVHDQTNYFDSQYIDSGFLFKRGKISKLAFRKLAEMLGCTYIKTVPTRYSSKEVIGYFPGTAAKVLRLINYIDSKVKSTIKTYDGTAPDEWIEAKKSETKVKRERLKGEITHYNWQNNRFTVMAQSLAEKNKAVFYMSNKEDVKEKFAFQCLYDTANKHFKENTELIFLSDTVIKKVSKIPNFHHAINLFKIGSYQNTLIRIRLQYILKKHIFNSVNRELLNYFSDYYSKQYVNLATKYNHNTIQLNHNTYYKSKDGKINVSINLYTHFKSVIDKKFYDKSRKYLLYEDTILPVFKACIKLKYFQYMRYTYMPTRELNRHVKKLKMLKLKSKFYSYGN